MDDRGSVRSGTRQALVRAPRALDRFLVRSRRVALSGAARGVFFGAALLVSACKRAPELPPAPEITEVVIGVPEANAQQEGRGLREFARLLTIEGFVRVGVDGTAVPWLASGWTWEADDMRLRVKLRPNVLLHDGTPLRAEMAAELITRGLKSPLNKALYPALNDVAGVATDGELDLVLTLTRTSPLLPADLTMQLRTGENGEIGTGPYRFKAASSDEVTDEVVLERFDRYYLGTPTIPTVVIRPFDTLRTAWTALLRGEADFVSDVPADAVEFIRNGDVQVIPYTRRYQFMIPFNARRGALRSPAVRKALNLAIDRQALISQTLQGAGTASTGPIWPDYWAYDKDVQSYTFAPAQATELLDAAGYPVRPSSGGEGPPARFRITCLIPEGFSVLERLALEVQKSLLNIGVDMQLQAVSAAEYEKQIVAGTFDAILMDMNSGPTPGRAYAFWRSRKTYQGPLNAFGYENGEAERLFTVINTSMNQVAVRSATGRLQEVLLNDPPALFIAWNTRARAIRREFVIPKDAEPIGSLWRWTVAPGARRASTPSAP